MLSKAGVLTAPRRWDGGLAGKWRADWGHDVVQLRQIAAKLEELEALYLITLIPPWLASATTRAKRRPKIIVLDTGLGR